jgi:hypothetical protein
MGDRGKETDEKDRWRKKRRRESQEFSKEGETNRSDWNRQGFTILHI